MGQLIARYRWLIAGVGVAVLAILVCTWLLAESDPRHLAWGAVAIVAGLALHLPLRRRIRVLDAA